MQSLGLLVTLALLWTATALAAAGSPPVLAERMTCPDPSTSVMTLEADGAAEIVAFRGFDPRTARSFMNRKHLPAADMQELLAILRNSGFDRLPDGPEDRPGPDTCLITLEIQLDGRQATLRYQGTPEPVTPAKALAKKIHAILDRHEWKE